MKHEFTGVFIPAKIWLSTELIPAEKMLLGEIEALSQRNGYCDASRAHFAKWLNCTVQNITYFMAKLERMGFITIEKKVGLRSKIRVVSERFYEKDVVNKVDSTSKSGLRVPVSPVYGGGKSHLPEIKEKRKEEIKESAPAQLSYSDTPKNVTNPESFINQLKQYYRDNPNEWTDGVRMVLPGRYTKDELIEFLEAYALHTISERTPYKTYLQHHAALCRWIKSQPNFERKPNAAKPQRIAEQSASDGLPRISATVKYRDGK